MTTKSTDPDPGPASGADPELLPPAGASVTVRLHWLFRHALRQGLPHPLLILLMQYRGVE
jgi:hypothetical protein